MIFVAVSLGWLVLVGVGGWCWLTSYVPWDWPGGINWRRLLLSSLAQGFCAAQVPWLALLATHLNRFFTSGQTPDLPHPAITALFRLATGPYWLSLSVFREVVPMVVAAVLLYAGAYLAVNLAGQLLAVRRGY